MKNDFEVMGGSYHQEGDYLLPNVEVPKSPTAGILNTPGGNRQFDRASPTPIPLKSYILSAAPTPPV